MKMKEVLIAYYTETDTTKEISQYISDKLKIKEYQVTLQPLDQVKQLDKFNTIIVGTPIHGMQIDQNTKYFLDTNLDKLRQKTIGLFYNSYLLDNGHKFWQKAIRKAYNKYQNSLNPVAIGEFYGRIDKHFSGLPKLLLGPKETQPLDRRDWNQVDQFIDKLLRTI